MISDYESRFVAAYDAAKHYTDGHPRTAAQLLAFRDEFDSIVAKRHENEGS